MERSSVLPIPREPTGGMVSSPSIWCELMGNGVADEPVAARSNVYYQPGMVHRFDPDHECHLLEGAAHRPQWVKTDEVNALMIEFLTR
jgi:pimeloyl-ACP methyl ester carboxylesterase